GRVWPPPPSGGAARKNAWGKHRSAGAPPADGPDPAPAARSPSLCPAEVGFTRLRPLRSAELGQARVRAGEGSASGSPHHRPSIHDEPEFVSLKWNIRYSALAGSGHSGHVRAMTA